MITTKYQRHQIHSEPLILCGYFRHSCAPKLLQKMGEMGQFLFRKQIDGGAASMAPSSPQTYMQKKNLILTLRKSLIEKLSKFSP